MFLHICSWAVRVSASIVCSSKLSRSIYDAVYSTGDVCASQRVSVEHKRLVRRTVFLPLWYFVRKSLPERKGVPHEATTTDGPNGSQNHLCRGHSTFSGKAYAKP